MNSFEAKHIENVFNRKNTRKIVMPLIVSLVGAALLFSTTGQAFAAAHSGAAAAAAAAGAAIVAKGPATCQTGEGENCGPVKLSSKLKLKATEVGDDGTASGVGTYEGLITSPLPPGLKLQDDGTLQFQYEFDEGTGQFNIHILSGVVGSNNSKWTLEMLVSGDASSGSRNNIVANCDTTLTNANGTTISQHVQCDVNGVKMPGTPFPST